jgi:hypothetical protein
MYTLLIPDRLGKWGEVALDLFSRLALARGFGCQQIAHSAEDQETIGIIMG